MKTSLGIALGLFLVALTPAAEPRKCATPPAQSNYRSFVPPASYVQNGSFHQPGVQHRHIRDVVKITSVAQINPAYVASYSPDGYDSATQADILAELRRLGLRVDQVAAVAQALKATQIGGSPLVQPTPPPSGSKIGAVGDVAALGTSIILAKCAACHQAGKLGPDQRFTLVDIKGNVVSLTDKQKLRIIQKTRTGQMPPPMNSAGIPSVTDAEFAAIGDYVGQ